MFTSYLFNANSCKKSNYVRFIIAGALIFLNAACNKTILNTQTNSSKNLEQSLAFEKSFRESKNIIDADIEQRFKRMENALLDERKLHLRIVYEMAKKLPYGVETLLAKINALRVEIAENSGGLKVKYGEKAKWEALGYKKLTEENKIEFSGIPVSAADMNAPELVFFKNQEAEKLKAQIINTRKNLLSEMDILKNYDFPERVQGFDEAKKNLFLSDPQNKGNLKWEDLNFKDLSVAESFALLAKLENDATAAVNQLVKVFESAFEAKILFYDEIDVFSQPGKAYLRRGETFQTEIGLGTYSTQADFTVNVNGVNVPVRKGKAIYSLKVDKTGTNFYKVKVNVMNPLTGKITSVEKEFAYEVGE